MKIQIISGFLGAGKTTFLNKYLPYLEGKTVVIENEFGEVGLDKKLIKNDVPVKEINSGCICCSLVTDFKRGIEAIVEQYSPDRIIVEPSGVAQLSDILNICEAMKNSITLEIEDKIVIVDACGFEDCIDVFGNFYIDQIANATLILFSNIDKIEGRELSDIVNDIKVINPNVSFYMQDWRNIGREELFELIEKSRHTKDYKSVDKYSNNTAGSVFESISLNNIKKHSFKDMDKLGDIIVSGEFGRVVRSKGIIPVDSRNDVDKNNSDIEFWHFDSNISSYDYRKISIDELKISDLLDSNGHIIVIGMDLEKDRIKKYFSMYKNLI